jgi:hypothetical protein
MDVCQNDLYSERFYTCSNYPDDNGVIVYPNVNTPQIIFFTFSYNSVTNPAEGKNLLENCLHRLGNIPIGINIISTSIPESFTVYPNYPNPFNPSTKIKFSIPAKSNVTLIIYDISGKVVEKLVDNQLAAGTYEAVWTAGNSASGIYFGVINADNYKVIVKMSLIK